MMSIDCDKFGSSVLKCVEFVQAVEGVACVLGECGSELLGSRVARKLVNQIGFRVLQGLLEMGIRGVTVSDVRGFGSQGGSTERHAGMTDLCYTFACDFYSVVSAFHRSYAR
uniref:Nitrogen regulatory p-II-like protein n=1 Tax=Eleusine coracana subsp. coracana TaxID=191504 RepID=A0A513U412_ELECO|nr:nitrogen regulatory p-II-like protein [Eleusine coracana subsp. coracana]